MQKVLLRLLVNFTSLESTQQPKESDGKYIQDRTEWTHLETRSPVVCTTMESSQQGSQSDVKDIQELAQRRQIRRQWNATLDE